MVGFLSRLLTTSYSPEDRSVLEMLASRHDRANFGSMFGRALRLKGALIRLFIVRLHA
jgi:hypothetical protein